MARHVPLAALLLLLVTGEGAANLLLLAPPSDIPPPTPLLRAPRSAVVGGGRPGQDFPALHSVPPTEFSCAGRRPGYYADPSTACQVFHVCHSALRKDSFLCPNGTIFHQLRLVCDWWYNVECSDSGLHEDVNADIGKVDFGRTRAADVRAGRGDTDVINSPDSRNENLASDGQLGSPARGRGPPSFGVPSSSAQGSSGNANQFVSDPSGANNFDGSRGESLGSENHFDSGVNEIQGPSLGPRISFRGSTGVSSQNNRGSARKTPRPTQAVPSPPTGPTLPNPDPIFENPATPRSSFIPSFGPTTPLPGRAGSGFNPSVQPSADLSARQQQLTSTPQRPASARRPTVRPLQSAAPPSLPRNNFQQGSQDSSDDLPPATISPTTISRQHQRQNQLHHHQQQVFSSSLAGGQPRPTQSLVPTTTPRPLSNQRTAGSLGTQVTQKPSTFQIPVRPVTQARAVTTAGLSVTTISPPVVTTRRPQVTQRRQTISNLLHSSPRARGPSRSEHHGVSGSSTPSNQIQTTPTQTTSSRRGQHNQVHQQQQQRHRDKGPKVSSVTRQPQTTAITRRRPLPASSTTRRQPTMTKVFRKPLGQALDTTTTPVRPISNRGQPTPVRTTTIARPVQRRPSSGSSSPTNRAPAGVGGTRNEDIANQISDVKDRFSPPPPPFSRRGGSRIAQQGGVGGTGLAIGTPVRVPNILSPLANPSRANAGRPLPGTLPQPLAQVHSSRFPSSGGQPPRNRGILLGTTDTTVAPPTGVQGARLPSVALPQTPVGGAPAVQLGSAGPPRILPTNLPHFNEILDFVRSVGGRPLLKNPATSQKPGNLAQRITPPPPIPFSPQGGNSLTHEQRDQQQQQIQLQQQRDIIQQQQQQERQNLVNLSLLQQQLQVQQQRFKKQQQQQILRQQQLIEQQQHKIEAQARQRQHSASTRGPNRGRGGAKFTVTLDDEDEDRFFDGDDHFNDDIDDIDDYDADDNDLFGPRGQSHLRGTGGPAASRRGGIRGKSGTSDDFDDLDDEIDDLDDILKGDRSFTLRPTPRFNRQVAKSGAPAVGGPVPPPAETFLPPPAAA